MFDFIKKTSELLIKIPIIGSYAQKIRIKILQTKFKNSTTYWLNRYSKGGNSGSGSYNNSAVFKAETINNFIKEYKITNVIEFGCGDGNQLKLSSYENYLGFDISPDAIILCKKIFHNDPSKRFKLMNEYANEKADLVLSLDVLYHLVEGKVFNNYMKILFSAANKFVIIYSTNTVIQRDTQAPHVKHRNFTKWIDSNLPNWNIIEHIPNKYSSTGKGQKKFLADFYIYKKL